MCTYVILFAACWGTGVSTGIVGTLWHVSHWDEQRKVCTEECVYVCLLLVEWHRCIRWNTVSGTLRCLPGGYRCVRFSLTWNIWLPVDPSRKGTPKPSPTCFFSKSLSTFLFLPTSSFLKVIVVAWFHCPVSNTVRLQIWLQIVIHFLPRIDQVREETPPPPPPSPPLLAPEHSLIVCFCVCFLSRDVNDWTL